MVSWTTSFPLEIMGSIDWQSSFSLYLKNIFPSDKFNSADIGLGNSVSLRMKITFFHVGWIRTGITAYYLQSFSTIFRHLH